MPADDAINLISRDFANYKNGGRSVPLNALLAKDKHPDAIQVLLNMLADNRQLTVLQYDRVLKYLEIRREEQVQIEVGDVKDIAPNAAAIGTNKLFVYFHLLSLLFSCFDLIDFVFFVCIFMLYLLFF